MVRFTVKINKSTNHIHPSLFLKDCSVISIARYIFKFYNKIEFMYILVKLLYENKIVRSYNLVKLTERLLQ